MMINHERVTKNLAQFVIDFFKDKETSLINKINEANAETFETLSKNLKSYPFETKFEDDNFTVKEIKYFVDEENEIIKSFIRDINKNITSVVFSGDIPDNLSFKNTKNITRETSRIVVHYSNI